MTGWFLQAYDHTRRIKNTFFHIVITYIEHDAAVMEYSICFGRRKPAESFVSTVDAPRVSLFQTFARSQKYIAWNTKHRTVLDGVYSSAGSTVVTSNPLRICVHTIYCDTSPPFAIETMRRPIPLTRTRPVVSPALRRSIVGDTAA